MKKTAFVPLRLILWIVFVLFLSPQFLFADFLEYRGNDDLGFSPQKTGAAKLKEIEEAKAQLKSPIKENVQVNEGVEVKEDIQVKEDISVGLPATSQVKETRKLKIKELEQSPPPEQVKYTEKPVIAARVNREIKYIPGADKSWLTKDDEVYHYFICQYDSKFRMVKRTCYVAAKDKKPFTEDDQVQEYQIFIYDKTDKLVKEIVSDSIGQDNQWFTADDGLKYKAVYEYDHSGNKSKEIRYGPADEITYYVIFEYVPGGLVVKDICYRGKGVDNQWFTQDDQIEKYHRFVYDSEGRLLQAMEYHADQNGAGVDGVWFNSDDFVSSIKEFISDGYGLKKKERKCIGPGMDNVWFTKDDVLQYYTIFEYKK